MVISQTTLWLLLLHSSVSEHQKDDDQQCFQGECEKRPQPSAETSFQPERQCSGKSAWLCLHDFTKTALPPRNHSCLQLQCYLWMQETSWRGALRFSYGEQAEVAPTLVSKKIRNTPKLLAVHLMKKREMQTTFWCALGNDY